MYQNIAWKLVPSLLFIALCVMISVMGLPLPDNHDGFAGFKLRLGQDLKGGTSLIYRMAHIEIAELDSAIASLRAKELQGQLNAAGVSQLNQLLGQRAAKQEQFIRDMQGFNDQTRDVLAKRLNTTGLAGVEVRSFGLDRLMITLPDYVDLNTETEKIIESSGRMLFRIEADKNDPNLANLKYPDNPDPSRYRWYPITEDSKYGREGVSPWDTADGRKWILIDYDNPDPERHASYNGDNLKRVYPTNGNNGELAVGFEFKDEQAGQFGNFTEYYRKDGPAWAGKEPLRLCVLFNEELYWAGVISSSIFGPGQMTGFDSRVHQQLMINLIKSGSLPVKLVQEGKNKTGAGLGQDSIQQGATAMAIGFALVVVFIVFFYLGGGVVAMIAIVTNLFITIAAMTMFSATLTMPGIAGLILSVGMAVDANILIYERIREEKLKTGSLRDSVERGFDRSASTILDANITTILTSLVLLIVGTPEIVGFAVTLVIGILASLFTSLLLSRFIVAALVQGGSIKRFAMLRLVDNPKVPFMRFRTPLLMLSTVGIIIGLAFFGGRGDKNLGIDFLGGHLFTVQLEQKTEVDDVRAAIAGIKDEAGNSKYTDAQVTPAFHPGELGGGTISDRFELRFPFPPGVEVDQLARQRMIRRDLEQIFTGSFVAEGRTEPLPALVVPSTTVDYRDMTKAGLRISIPLSGPLTLENAAQTVSMPIADGKDPEPIEGLGVQLYMEQIANLPLSNQGELGRYWRPTQDDASNEGSGIISVNGSSLIYTISGVAVDPTSFGKGPNDFMTAIPAAVKKWFAEPTPYSRAVLEHITLDSSEPIHIEIIPEKADVVIKVNLGERNEVPLEQFLARPPGAPKDGEKKYLEVAVKLRGFLGEQLESAGAHIKGLSVPIGTDPKDDANFGLELKDPTTQTVRSFRICTGVTEFAKATSPTSELYAPTVIERISKLSRTWLGDKANIVVSEPFLREQAIGAAIANDLKDKAAFAVAISLLLIVLYIWIRFRTFSYGLGATMALAHDVAFSLGAIAVFDQFTTWNVKLDLTVIAALLTIIGYSLNDTIVVFDRIRENRQGVKPGVSFLPYVNTSVNQTLSRTLLTSGTTLLTVFVMFVLGGRVLEAFALTLLAGIVVGTYSSIFIAAIVLTVPWEKYQNLIYSFIGLSLVVLVLQAFPATRQFIPLFVTGVPWHDLLIYLCSGALLGTWVATGVHCISTMTSEPGTAFMDDRGVPQPVAAVAAVAPVSGAASAGAGAKAETPSAPAATATAEKPSDAPKDAAASDGADSGDDDDDDDDDDDSDSAGGESPAASTAASPASSGGGGGGKKDKGGKKGKGGKGKGKGKKGKK
ncbi:MAG: protein translocase subunit SecD [Planctomycetota bacterium]